MDDVKQLEQHVADLEESLENAQKERDAALADNAALMERGNRLHDLAQHDEACKMLVGDDLAMCDCAMGEWQQVQRDAHPGAALVQRLRKSRSLPTR